MKDFIAHEIGKWRYVIATRHIERQ